MFISCCDQDQHWVSISWFRYKTKSSLAMALPEQSITRELYLFSYWAYFFTFSPGW